MLLLTSDDDFELIACRTCGEQSENLPFRDRCYTCELAAKTLASAKHSCGEVEHSRFWLGVMPGLQTRLNKLGFDVELLMPTLLDRLRGRIRLKLKALSDGCCKGPAAVVLAGVSADPLSSPHEVASGRKKACFANCPVVSLDPHTPAVKALTKRCAEAIGAITDKPVKVPLSASEIPALLGAMRNLKDGGWKASVNSTNSYLRHGEIVIYPAA